MNQTVKFDPGIGELVIDFNDFINDVYSRMMSMRTIHQKRTGFKLFDSKIRRIIKNNISFYLGCLLWAYYIVKENENNPKQISGNVFLGLTEEEKENYDYMIQVNFLENYFDSYERDSLYYTGKKVCIPENWKKILKLYSEFLKLNNGFVETKTTADIVLPEEFPNKTFDFDILSYINKAISEKDLEILLNIDNLAI